MTIDTSTPSDPETIHQQRGKAINIPWLHMQIISSKHSPTPIIYKLVPNSVSNYRHISKYEFNNQAGILQVRTIFCHTSQYLKMARIFFNKLRSKR